jgi:quercetin dioxygenase-like cupin family protein
MKTTVHEWDGFLLSLFQMDKGEKIARHQHNHVHTTSVARGKTEVEIYSVGIWGSGSYTEGEIFVMVPGYRDRPFPPNIPHEIRALEDDTIVVNLTHLHSLGPPAKSGGLMLEDETVVYEPWYAKGLPPTKWCGS